MGKGGKAQTVGYKYYLGMHLALCHGPIDKITRLRVDDRDAWIGEAGDTTINVNAPELFGGEKREGGVSGAIDVCMGRPTQLKNSYLQKMLGALIPAYRGVVGLVFRQCYLGNNPYLKTWAARGQRIHVRQDGIAQWYDIKSEIPSVGDVRYKALFLVWEMRPSGGGVNITPAATQTSTFVTGDGETYNVPLRVRGTVELRSYPGGVAVGDHVVKGGVPGTPAFANIYKMEISNPPAVYYFNSGNFGAGELYAIDSVVNVQVTDGATVTLTASTGSDSAMSGTYQYLSLALDGITQDMNAAHIIRECLTDPEWGMGYTDDDIDEDSFVFAADTFHGEGLGLSLLWDKTKKIEDFVSMVQEHVDCALYVSRTTGKFVLKPIRGGYDESTLLHLNESNIVSVDDPTRITFGELTNSVTVSYWNASTGKDASVTISDTALVQQQGVIINAPLQYPGFTNALNATIAAQRDLRALSSPLLSCTITADSDAKVLNIGDVFKFSWAKWGLVEVVMRVNGISYGTGRNNRVKISCTQDVFDTDTNVSIVVPDTGWTDPSGPPSVVEQQLVAEAPYYELVQALGQSDTDNKLLTHPEIGYLIAAGSRPASAINAALYTDDGAGYEDVGAMDFCPSGVLSTNITKTQPNFVLSGGTDLGEVTLGTHVQIGEELMRVDAIDANTGAMMVGRGVLDTVPEEHLAGEVAFFWDAYAGFDPTEYVQGEEVNAKIIPISGAGVLPLDAADAMTLTLDQRACRPYAPGDLRINGESYAVNAYYEGEVTVTWKHRNRIEQTGGYLDDYTAGDIGPEPGVEYRLRVYVDDVFDQEIEPAVSPQAVTPIGSGLVRIEVHAKRDGVYSWQAPSHSFINSRSRLTEEGDLLYTEDGDARLVED